MQLILIPFIILLLLLLCTIINNNVAWTDISCINSNYFIGKHLG